MTVLAAEAFGTKARPRRRTRSAFIAAARLVAAMFPAAPV